MISQAVGFTYYDDEREIPSYKVKGKLTIRYVPTLDYNQYDIDGTIVDPRTITVGFLNVDNDWLEMMNGRTFNIEADSKSLDKIDRVFGLPREEQ